MDEQFILVGVGGAGGRIANRIAESTDGLITAIAIDTDFTEIGACGQCQQVRIGHSILDGYGTGGNVSSGRNAAEQDDEQLQRALSGASVAVVIAGLGGGAGAGITPVFLRMARNLNVRTLVFGVMPFAFESDARRDNARRVCAQFEESADVFITAENDRLCASDAALGEAEAFDVATKRLAAGVMLFWRLVKKSAYLKLDATDLKNILALCRGRARFACAIKAGETRQDDVMTELLCNEDTGLGDSLNTARAALIGIESDSSLRLSEVSSIMARFRNSVSEHCSVFMGTVLDPAMSGALGVVGIVFENYTTQEQPEYDAPRQPAGVSITPQATVSSPANVSTPPPVQDPTRSKVAGRSAKKRGKTTPTMGWSDDDRWSRNSSYVVNGEDLNTPTYLRRGLNISNM